MDEYGEEVLDEYEDEGEDIPYREPVAVVNLPFNWPVEEIDSPQEDDSFSGEFGARRRRQRYSSQHIKQIVSRINRTRMNLRNKIRNARWSQRRKKSYYRSAGNAYSRAINYFNTAQRNQQTGTYNRGLYWSRRGRTYENNGDRSRY